ncbi:SLC13 family permease [Nocardioides insulae]|uniref:GntT/GntP/DsdX family permease n=1 Tax=Nocardioides insulae TaxID=394734 RepID=UPI0004174112|nr:SLC13 family permease [Nocardioides insulae]
MPLLVVAIAVAILLVLMTRYRLNGFIALFVVAILVGLVQGMPVYDVYDSILEGVGGQLDELVLILGFGAMLGKVLADSGAADRIALSLTRAFGISRVQLAVMLTSVCIGITLFYEVAFVLLIPLVFTLVRQHRLPLLWVGLPMSITLSTMHSFLPPHPGPAAVAGTFGASQGLTLLYGLPIACVAAAVVGYTWPRLPFVRAMNPTIPTALTTDRDFAEEDLPRLGTCIAVVAIPIAMMAVSAATMLSLPEGSSTAKSIEFFGEAPIALLVALVLAVVLLGGNIIRLNARAEQQLVAVGAGSAGTPGGSGVAGGGTGSAYLERPAPPTGLTARFQAAMESCGDAVKPMALIILVIGAGGAFKQVLVDSGIADYIEQLTHGWDISPLILAWVIAAVVRAALGSASVAVVTAAGIVMPLLGDGVSPELMVLAVTSGSIAFSHVNDPGFWLFKEYLNLSVIDTIKVRTTYSTVVGVIGLLGVLTLSTVV